MIPNPKLSKGKQMSEKDAAGDDILPNDDEIETIDDDDDDTDDDVDDDDKDDDPSVTKD